MDTVIHQADQRGYSNHGWLKSYHSFSFANYVNPNKTHFGALRVLNDDTVDIGRGFGMHPHQNMEIISIPLSGTLEHQDNMGNRSVIQMGDVQVMSAGTGILHSEYNKNQDQEVQFLQIWVIPNRNNVEPRYDQISTSSLKKRNQLYQILSPTPADNGVYTFVIEGEVTISGENLASRDAIGIWNTQAIEITAESDCRFLVMDVPMVS